MANDSSLVLVTAKGGIYVSLDDSGSVPTDAATTIDAGFDELGYITDAGITQSINRDTTEIKAWQNSDVVRRVQSSHEVTYQFSCLETNPYVLEAYYGNYAAGKVEIKGDVLPRLKWVIDTFDGDNHVRLVIPSGQVSTQGDTVYSATDALVYPLTITAYPVDGVKATIYSNVIGSS